MPLAAEAAQNPRVAAAFVDAGFLKREGERAVGIRPASRTFADRPLNAAALMGTVASVVSDHDPFGAPPLLLRAYWYDGAFAEGHSQRGAQRDYFDTIADTPGVLLRLGHVQEYRPSWHRAVRRALQASGTDIVQFERHFQFTPERNQKGVDTLITLDLVSLAQRRAIQTAILLSGDRDLAEVVRTVQNEGCRVVVVTPAPSTRIAKELRQVADGVTAFTSEQIHRILNVPLATNVPQ